jgi:hypothetical protein
MRIFLDLHVSRCSAAILPLEDASERDVPLICVYVATLLYMTHEQKSQLMRGCAFGVRRCCSFRAGEY